MLDQSIRGLGLRVLRTPLRALNANAICERVIGTIRSECLDWLIPLSEAHLRVILTEWMTHYNRGRPHMSLGPGVPDPPKSRALPDGQGSLDRIRIGENVGVKSVAGGLHRESSLVDARA